MIVDIPVDDRFPLSAPKRTMGHKESTKQTTPGHTVLEHRPGASPATKGIDRLMHSVEPSTDTPPPPTCPLCAKPAASSSVRLDSPSISIGDYRCPTGHIWTTRWLVAG